MTCLVRVANQRVTVRPIAGTRPRGRSREEDEALAAELLADEKERSEHVMLVDLGRNDVGRVAEFGTVAVTESDSRSGTTLTATRPRRRSWRRSR